MTRTAIIAGLGPLALSGRLLADDGADRAARIEARGDRIEHHLDKKGDRIERRDDRRLDRKGGRIDRRTDRRARRVAAGG